MAWEDKDKYCLYCGNVTKEARGWNKQNVKKLFFAKPTGQEMSILVILLLVGLMSWRYSIEMDAYRELIEDPGPVCMNYFQNQRTSAAMDRYWEENLDINYTAALEKIMSNFSEDNLSEVIDIIDQP